jgi:hypothetical protein
MRSIDVSKTFLISILFLLIKPASGLDLYGLFAFDCFELARIPKSNPDIDNGFTLKPTPLAECSSVWGLRCRFRNCFTVYGSSEARK